MTITSEQPIAATPVVQPLESSSPTRSSPATATRIPSWRTTSSRYLVLGFLCGIVLLKSEIAAWFRIQEMLRFQGFHMFGFFFSSVFTAGLTLQVVRRRYGLAPPPKEWGTGARYLFGGVTFGIGWGLLSGCPGPIYALIGSGVSVLIVTLIAVLAGTWLYGVLRPRLPH